MKNKFKSRTNIGKSGRKKYQNFEAHSKYTEVQDAIDYLSKIPLNKEITTGNPTNKKNWLRLKTMSEEDMILPISEATNRLFTNKKLPEDFNKNPVVQKIIMDNTGYWKYPTVKDDNECYERLEAFFKWIEDCGSQYDIVPTPEKLCLVLGISYETFENWCKGSMGEIRQQLMLRARQMLAAIESDMAISGLIPANYSMFRAKNFYGMKEKVEHTYQTTNKANELSQEERNILNEYNKKIISVDAYVVNDEE